MTRKRMKNHHPVPERYKLDADWLSLRSPSCPTALCSITFPTRYSTYKICTLRPEIHKFPAQLITNYKLIHFSLKNTALYAQFRKSSLAPVKRSTNQKSRSIFRIRSHAHYRRCALVYRTHTLFLSISSKWKSGLVSVALVCVCVQFLPERKLIAPTRIHSHQDTLWNFPPCLQFSALFSHRFSTLVISCYQLQSGWLTNTGNQRQLFHTRQTRPPLTELQIVLWLLLLWCVVLCVVFCDFEFVSCEAAICGAMRFEFWLLKSSAAESTANAACKTRGFQQLEII